MESRPSLNGTKRSMAETVLFLSIDGMTDPLGQSQVLPYLKGLSAKGHQITLVSCEKPERFSSHSKTIEDICSESEIDWQPIEYKSKIPLLSSISNIQRMRRMADKLHAQKQFTLVHCRSYLPMFSGQWLKKKHHLKLLFDIRGFWPDERVDGRLWKLTNPLWNFIYKYFKRKEKQFFELADKVISLTHNAKKEIHSWPLENNPIPIHVIPCCADLNLFNYHNIVDEEKQQLLAQLKLKTEDYIITYLGSLGTFYAIEDMLTYFMALKERRPNAKFLIITASPPEIVWNAIDNMSIDPNDIRVTRASRPEVPLHLSLGVYSLVFYKENFSRKACSPTKLGELMGLGIPVVCSPNVGDTTEIVNDTASGVSLNTLSIDEYRRVVSEMEEFPYEDKASIRAGAHQYFDLHSGIEKYHAAYSQTLLSS